MTVQIVIVEGDGGRGRTYLYKPLIESPPPLWILLTWCKCDKNVTRLSQITYLTDITPSHTCHVYTCTLPHLGNGIYRKLLILDKNYPELIKNLITGPHSWGKFAVTIGACQTNTWEIGIRNIWISVIWYQNGTNFQKW